VRPLLPGLHAHVRAARFLRVPARMPPSGPGKARQPEPNAATGHVRLLEASAEPAADPPNAEYQRPRTADHEVPWRTRRAPGGAAAGPPASPKRRELHHRRAPCEPAAPPGSGGSAGQPVAHHPARPSRHIRGSSWHLPPGNDRASLCGRLWPSHRQRTKAALRYIRSTAGSPVLRTLARTPAQSAASRLPKQGIRDRSRH
jgi:hypothetical protein